MRRILRKIQKVMQPLLPPQIPVTWTSSQRSHIRQTRSGQHHFVSNDYCCELRCSNIAELWHRSDHWCLATHLRRKLVARHQWLPIHGVIEMWIWSWNGMMRWGWGARVEAECRYCRIRTSKKMWGFGTWDSPGNGLWGLNSLGLNRLLNYWWFDLCTFFQRSK